MKFDLTNFKSRVIIANAFIHRSYLNEHRAKNLESNERLEFLGDAVLELIVSLFIFKEYPKFSEGELTSLRSKLVQTKTLGLAAERLGFGSLLKLSKGERASGGNKNISILADTFEAFIGALYQSEGFDPTYNFVLENLLVPAEKQFNNLLPKDYKSRLQEIVQGQGKSSPVYKVLESFGPDHDKTFNVAVLIESKKLTQGVGKSKQAAEQEAAKKALKILKL